MPLRKRVAIALWKLATGGEYRSVSQIFGVGLTTVLNCVKDLCDAVNKVLLPVHIKFPDAWKLVEMASFFLTTMESTTMCWCYRWKPHPNNCTHRVSSGLLQQKRVAFNHLAGSSGCEGAFLGSVHWLSWKCAQCKGAQAITFVVKVK